MAPKTTPLSNGSLLRIWYIYSRQCKHVNTCTHSCLQWLGRLWLHQPQRLSSDSGGGWRSSVCACVWDSVRADKDSLVCKRRFLTMCQRSICESSNRKLQQTCHLLQYPVWLRLLCNIRKEMHGVLGKCRHSSWKITVFQLPHNATYKNNNKLQILKRSRTWCAQGWHVL